VDANALIGVIGAGTMGNGIAHVCARAGFQVLLYDVNHAALYQGLKTIQSNFGREVAKQRLTEQQADEARSRRHGWRRWQGRSW
jgi:3-hydroxybutyryl-CoA dehydrogenase